MTASSVEREKAENFKISDDRPVYSMGVTSELVELPMWTLRTLDQEKIVIPKRTSGQTRLYSMNDLKVLVRIRVLVDKGLNMAGIRLMIERGDAKV